MSLIDRQAAIEALRKCQTYLFNRCDPDKKIELLSAEWAIEDLPPAYPEHLTDDDFETIRIHLNAYKEKLCNQQRWTEAKDYQRIIDRFMAYASAQPEWKKGEWIYGEHDVAMCDGYRCSECGFFVPRDYEHKFIDFIKDYNFCPNCGAMMEGEKRA